MSETGLFKKTYLYFDLLRAFKTAMNLSGLFQIFVTYNGTNKFRPCKNDHVLMVHT